MIVLNYDAFVVCAFSLQGLENGFEKSRFLGFFKKTKNAKVQILGFSFMCSFIQIMPNVTF